MLVIGGKALKCHLAILDKKQFNAHCKRYSFKDDKEINSNICPNSGITKHNKIKHWFTASSL